MPRLSRKLRVCKWVGTVGCALTVAAFVSCLWYKVVLDVYHVQGVLYSVWLAEGSVALTAYRDGGRERRRWLILDDPYELWSYDAPGWLPRTSDPRFRWADWSLVLPLGIPSILLLVPTLLLWRRDRRRPRPGCCPHCDYDLTGNTSGVCPECGREIVKPGGVSVRAGSG